MKIPAWLRRTTWTLALAAASGLPAVPRPAAEELERSGFDRAVELIPQVGLWADGSVEIGFAKKSGLVVWWGLTPPPPAPGKPAVDWQRVTFRIRAEAYEPSGKRVANEEALIEPLTSDGASTSGGFPTPLHLVLSAGEYRIHLEAYPLISAEAAGFDSALRGTADVQVSVPEMTVGSRGWRLSDILFLDSVRPWEAGSSPDRAWYDWVIRPNVARAFGVDTTTAYAAFELLRSAEVVPQCGPGMCRVVITVSDAGGGIVAQDLRAVPDAGVLQAYVVPFPTDSLAPGGYDAEIEVYDGPELRVSTRRGFRVVAARP